MRLLWKSLKWIGGVASTFFILAIALPSFLGSTYSAPAIFNSDQEPEEENFVVTHLDTPEPLKALYMTACVAATPSWRQSLKELIEATELNSVVIDIKDYSGSVSFESGANCYIRNLREFIGELHDSEIYVIGRIAVFQDPRYTALHPELAVRNKAGEVWRDYKGLSFIDVGAKPYWDYIIDISKQSYELGFDELNFDYVRYPSDGNMEDTLYSWNTASSTKAEMLESFFSYLDENLQTYKLQNLKTSVDIFGMTTTASHDLGIGQVLEKTLPYFDYVSPMVYPSHYPPTWSGFANPAEYPYEVVKIAMAGALAKASTTPMKLRPWLQDFNLGAVYSADKVRAQIQAVYDTGLTSWMLWSAANIYTKEALLPN